MKYQFIAKEAQVFSVRRLCRVLGVKKSSYYDWKRAGGKVVPLEEFRLRQRLKELFFASRESAGSRTLARLLRAEGFRIGRYRVRRLMKSMGLVVKPKRRFRVTTDSNHGLPVAQNVLDRQFSPCAINRVWASDITYVWTVEGWLYLAVVIDLYSRRVVGWAMSNRADKALVIRALMMAIAMRQPPPGLIHHSDRGSQYASRMYQQLLNAHAMIPSMSRKGNCWDNAPVERFFGSLKREWIGDRLYQTRDQAIADIRDYIVGYYNSRRLHSTLGYVTPISFEKCA